MPTSTCNVCWLPNWGSPGTNPFAASINELIHPKKLPPLELTSKPVPVEELWGFYGGQEKKAGLMSVLIHVGVVVLLVVVGSNPTVQQIVKEQVTLIAPDHRTVPTEESDEEADDGRRWWWRRPFADASEQGQVAARFR